MLLRLGSRKLALGACDRELVLPRKPAKLLGGSLRGVGAPEPWGTLLLRASLKAMVRLLTLQSGPLFGSLGGRPRCSPGESPEGAPKKCFQLLPEPLLTGSLSLYLSFRSPLC